MNRAWEAFTGRPAAEARGEGWLDAVHADDRESVARQWREALARRAPLECEHRLARAGGGHGWVHFSAGALAEGAALQGYLGTWHDIAEQREAELAARNHAREVRLLADNLPALIAHFKAPELRCAFANRAYAEFWGWDTDSVRGRTVAEVIGPEGFREIEPHIRRVVRGESVNYERTVPSPDGPRVIQVDLLPQLAEDGAVVAAFVLISDITRHRLSELAIRESEERLRKFAQATNEGIVFHEKGILTDANDAALRLIGHAYEELVGRPVLDFVAPESREAVFNSIRMGYERPYEGVIVHKDGSRIDVELSGKVMPYKGEHYRMTVLRDIRERKQAEARIQFLAHHDVLTGLPNRALLRDRLEFVLASARRRDTKVGVLFLDLDNFKTVNDSLGHAAGDALLRVVASRIQDSLRSVDVVARLGGDEFLVVLPDLEDERASGAVAEKLLAAVSQPVSLGERTLSVSPSIGIAIFPRDGADTDTLIGSADAAMYLAKDRGRSNYQFFSERLARAASDTLALEERLREGLRQQAFELHYQPQVEARTGKLVGMEALLRWPQPDGTLALPGDFIRLAEQRGLIVPLGAWVLRTACRQNRLWQLSGLPQVPVWVNLAANQFRQRGLVEEVEKALADTGLDPALLAFELTESMLMEDTPDLLRTLGGLRALGVHLAIDGFGTGHSSLSRLKRFPIDKLKIDRAFVRDLPGDIDDAAITGAIIDLARNLGITSAAVGVETAAQRAFLEERGCRELQGFLFGAPQPAAGMARYLAERRDGATPPGLSAALAG